MIQSERRELWQEVEEKGMAPAPLRKASSRLLLVGLNNCGAKFEGTRHNIGADIVSAFGNGYIRAARRGKRTTLDEADVFGAADVHHEVCFQRGMASDKVGLDLVDAQSARRKARTRKEGARASVVDVALVRPTTLYNNSGKSVRLTMDMLRMWPSSVVVVCDDTELPFGTFRVRSKGKHGGNNGLASVESHLGTNKFTRVRIGVGPCPDRSLLAPFVLSRFSAEEKQKMFLVHGLGCAILRVLVHRGYAEACRVAAEWNIDRFYKFKVDEAKS